MFAIQILDLNLSSSVRYFDIVSKINVYNPQTIDNIVFPLVQCTPEHWEGNQKVDLLF